jgi:hypothetical protein
MPAGDDAQPAFFLSFAVFKMEHVARRSVTLNGQLHTPSIVCAVVTF